MTHSESPPKCPLGYSLLQCEDARESGRLRLPKCEFCYLGCPVAARNAVLKVNAPRVSLPT